MLRWLLLLVTGMLILFAFAAPRVSADDPPGAQVYATYCAGCHGAAGKGGLAPAIGSEKYLGAKDDATIAQVTSEGIVSKGMPAWGKPKGGALSDEQIASIVAYLRTLAPTSSAPAPSPPPTTVPGTLLVQTKLTLAQTTDEFGDTVLSATLKESSGNPVNGATIAFSRATAWGVVELGTAKTGANGIATLLLREVPANAREVVARFKGDKNFEASTNKLVVEPSNVGANSSREINLSGVRLSVEEPLLAPEGSLITPNPPLLPAGMLALVVGSIWATYAYVAYQAYRIWRRGKDGSRENLLRNARR